ncbi:type II toxin-antitoxin system RelE/ParE family toxin [Lapidilactobacillus mulanensis]|uniref:type II toxin-antitoxin system RelE/ParE family toxin n=1 Tax=Lapidilactobacillus mulanensis TaxID=2485999 RepID=UPI0013DE465E|nr:type II toxin-antitoxin system RelE/ParE family toxin [Lapidilactobacillus mulanensis]
MVYNVRISNPARKYLKKLKDKKLTQLFIDNIYNIIAADPEMGTRKVGDLADTYTVGFRYQTAEYRIAYRIKEDMIVIILLVGSHADFYADLKKYLH